jgi:hypothetical protein
VRDALLEPWIADYRSTTIRDEELLEIAEPDRSREDVLGRHWRRLDGAGQILESRRELF